MNARKWDEGKKKKLVRSHNQPGHWSLQEARAVPASFPRRCQTSFSPNPRRTRIHSFRKKNNTPQLLSCPTRGPQTTFLSKCTALLIIASGTRPFREKIRCFHHSNFNNIFQPIPTLRLYGITWGLLFVFGVGPIELDSWNLFRCARSLSRPPHQGTKQPYRSIHIHHKVLLLPRVPIGRH